MSYIHKGRRDFPTWENIFQLGWIVNQAIVPLNNTLKHVEITDGVVQDEHNQDVNDLDWVFVNTSIFYVNQKTREILSKSKQKAGLVDFTEKQDFFFHLIYIILSSASGPKIK